MKIRFLVAALLMLAGCAHRERHFTPPDAAPMHASYANAKQAVTTAREHLVKSKAALVAAAATAKDEQAKIDALEPQLQTLLRASPAELSGQVQEALTNVTDLKAEHARLVPQIAEGVAETAAAEVQLAAAETALTQHSKDMAAYEAGAVKNTDAANTAQAGWTHDSQVATHLILHSLLFKLLAGLAIVVVAIVALLYFTNTLGAKAAAIASHIP